MKGFCGVLAAISIKLTVLAAGLYVLDESIRLQLEL